MSSRFAALSTSRLLAARLHFRSPAGCTLPPSPLRIGRPLVCPRSRAGVRPLHGADPEGSNRITRLSPQIRSTSVSCRLSEERDLGLTVESNPAHHLRASGHDAHTPP